MSRKPNPTPQNAPLAGLAHRLTGGRMVADWPADPVTGTPSGSVTDYGYVKIHRYGALCLVIRHDSSIDNRIGGELVAMARAEWSPVGKRGEGSWDITSIDMCGNDEIDDDTAAEISADAGRAADATCVAERARVAAAYAGVR